MPTAVLIRVCSEILADTEVSSWMRFNLRRRTLKQATNFLVSCPECNSTSRSRSLSISQFSRQIAVHLSMFPAMDFGCYIYIKNDCHSSLLRQETSITKGKWQVEPEKVIPKGASYQFVLQDKPGLDGSAGSVEYMLDAPKNPTVEIRFSCPTTRGSKNVLAAEAKVPLKVHTECQVEGHPMHGETRFSSR